MPLLDLNLINEAAVYLEGKVRRTPLAESPLLSELLGVPVFLKLEFQQITGSFKLRGALFRLAKLAREERDAGVITCSAGNHGWAIAYAARRLGIKATVYVPNTIDRSKKQGIESLGADVIVSQFAGYDDTERYAVTQSEAFGQPFISPYDDPEIMAANGGTLAKEILADAPEVGTFVIPVGGGGLGAGLGFFTKALLPDSHLIACQHIDSPALRLSLEQGRAVTELPAIDTLAAGIEGGIGANTFSILKDKVDRVVLLTEDEILEAVRWFLERLRYLIEPSSAVALAACLREKLGPVQNPVAVVLTGRNLAYSSLKKIVDERGD